MTQEQLKELMRSQQGELDAVLMYQRLAKVVKTDKERESELLKQALPQDFVKFGLIPEFIGRVEEIADKIPQVSLVYEGAGCPSFADDLTELINESSSSFPPCTLTEDDDAAIYFSSGTTGFPKAILHKHLSLMTAATVVSEPVPAVVGTAI